MSITFHWGRFDLSLHAWDEPIERLKAAASQHDITVVIPMVGQRTPLYGEHPMMAWWREGGLSLPLDRLQGVLQGVEKA